MSHTLYLVRHGATASTVSHRVCGSSDVPLSAQGEAEMGCVSKYFADKDVSMVFSSPLQRACKPASALAAARNVKHTVIDEVQEINFGKWEGLSFATLGVLWPLEVARMSRMSVDYTFPNGE